MQQESRSIRLPKIGEGDLYSYRCLGAPVASHFIYSETQSLRTLQGSDLSFRNYPVKPTAYFSAYTDGCLNGRVMTRTLGTAVNLCSTGGVETQVEIKGAHNAISTICRRNLLVMSLCDSNSDAICEMDIDRLDALPDLTACKILQQGNIVAMSLVIPLDMRTELLEVTCDCRSPRSMCWCIRLYCFSA